MKRTTGQMRFRLHCQAEGSAEDELGNPVPDGGPFETRFTVSASMIPRNGGEAVIAGRLEGRQPFIVTVRSSELTRQITSEWRLVDARTDKVFAVKTAADPDGKRQWIDLLVEEGVAP